MIIIGINNAYHEQTVAIIINGKLVAAAEEERFNRIRHGKPAHVRSADDLPWQSINYCLKEAGVNFDDVDHIGYSFEPQIRRTHQWPEEIVEANDNQVEFGLRPGEEQFFQSNLRARDQVLASMKRAEFHFLSHHLCHAASTYLASPFQEAGILIVDGIGETASSWTGHAVGQKITRIAEIQYPNSIGFLWEKVSEFLGFDRYDGPGKLMALGASAFHIRAQPLRNYLKHFKKFINLTEEGFYIDPNVLRYRANDFYTLESVLGVKQNVACRDLEERAAIASGLQAVTEEILVHLAESLYRHLNTGRTQPVANLCLAGGVALNCVANAQVMDRTSWKRLWVQPAANDAGTGLGAALVVWNLILGNSARVNFPHAYWGPGFSPAECKEALQRATCAFSRPQHLKTKVAELIGSGKSVAWFQGRMEFGPRALGNRSILADPCRREMRNTLNTHVKERECFRPFAPSLLDAAAEEFFEIPFDRNSEETNPLHFMLAAVPVKEGMAEHIPSVVQINRDNRQATSRIHLVNQKANPNYFELLEAVGRVSGLPMVLNTSFNVAEPIVCSPDQAIATFCRSNIDALALGPFLVTR